MTYEAIRVDTADGVMTITLNRPDVHNAMNNAMRRELTAVFEGLRTDDAVRVVLVTGAGERAFSAGADIREFTKPLVPRLLEIVPCVADLMTALALAPAGRLPRSELL